MGSYIPFIRTDGKKAQGYLAKAAKANAPGVVVIQEWWGLAGNITALCERLALAGYDALAPDLYGGTLVPYHDHHAAEAELINLILPMRRKTLCAVLRSFSNVHRRKWLS